MITDWQEQALCKGYDTEIWFPVMTDESAVHRAKAICRRCPVQGPCLATALAEEAHESPRWCFGIFGGLKPSERARIRTDTVIHCTEQLDNLRREPA